MFKTDRRFADAHLSLLLRAALLGLSFSAVGLMGDSLPPLLLTSLRFFIAALAMAPLVWLGQPRWPTAREMMIYSLLGLCQAMFFGGMFWAAHRVTAVSMTVLYISVPFLTYCLGVVLRVERSSAPMLGVLAIGAVGAFALAWADSARAEAGGAVQVGAGEVVFFAGCIGLAVYGTVSKWGLERDWLCDGAAARTFWSLAVGGVLVGAFGLLTETPAPLLRLTSSDLLLLVYLGVYRRHLLSVAAGDGRTLAGSGKRLRLRTPVRLHAGAVRNRPAEHLLALGARRRSRARGDRASSEKRRRQPIPCLFRRPIAPRHRPCGVSSNA